MKGFNRLDKVYSIGGQICITVQSFSRLFYLSEKQIFRLIKKKILKAFKWKHIWYIFLPKKKLATKPSSKEVLPNQVEKVELPNGQNIELNWSETIPKLPEDVASKFTNQDFKFSLVNGTLYTSTSQTKVASSTLSPKTQLEIIPLSLQAFRSTNEYKYGFYISYDQNKMSTFDPGTSGSLKATQIPAAFFEVCRLLDAAEQNRNGANPGLPPRRNLATTISFDTGTISVAATLPITTSIHTDGSIDVSTQDYLSSTYSTFTHGGGDLVSTTVMGAFLELASKLAAEEKLVQPADSQPNNVQISFDLEAGAATVSANLPFTTAAATNGDVTIHAIDYL